MCAAFFMEARMKGRLIWTLVWLGTTAFALWNFSKDPGFNAGQAITYVFVFALIWLAGLATFPKE